MTKFVPNDVNVERAVLKIPFKIFGRVTVGLPLGSLIFCFTSAVLWQFNEVNETVCSVKNFIPSISAVTGVAPQRFVWRICIALHCAPRFALALLYVNYYMARIINVAESQRGLFKALVWINCIIYTVENACLVLVSYIANWENYPVHEKLFMVFMVTALVYELLSIVLFRWCHSEQMNKYEKFSYRWKCICFTLIMIFTSSLLYFFLRHRLYCEPNAFSWFSLSEYGIAITNIGFHYTGATDFRDHVWLVGLPKKPVPVQNNHKKRK